MTNIRPLVARSLPIAARDIRIEMKSWKLLAYLGQNLESLYKPPTIFSLTVDSRRAWCRREGRKGRRPPPLWPRTPLRPERAKKRRWAPLRPRPRRPIYDLQG